MQTSISGPRRRELSSQVTAKSLLLAFLVKGAVPNSWLDPPLRAVGPQESTAEIKCYREVIQPLDGNINIEWDIGLADKVEHSTACKQIIFPLPSVVLGMPKGNPWSLLHMVEGGGHEKMQVL